MIEPTEFLDLFVRTQLRGLTQFTPKPDNLAIIHKIWRKGTLNFGHLLLHTLEMARDKKINRQVRFSDGGNGYWDVYLIREGLFINVYNRLDWGIDSVKFADSSFCSLQVQLAGHSIEKFNRQAAEQGSECLYINSNCKLQFELFSESPQDLVKIYVSYSRRYLADQIISTPHQHCRDNEVSLHRFAPTPKIYQFASRIVELQPLPSTIIRAEALALGIIAETLDVTDSMHEAPGNFALRKSDIKALECAKRLLEQEYHNPITLDSVARKVGINRKKLNDGFQLLNGVTFGEFLLRSRMKAASDLLKQGHMTADIAERIGYSNRSAFSGAFKRHFGCSPRDYLKGIEPVEKAKQDSL